MTLNIYRPLGPFVNGDNIDIHIAAWMEGRRGSANNSRSP